MAASQGEGHDGVPLLSTPVRNNIAWWRGVRGSFFVQMLHYLYRCLYVYRTYSGNFNLTCMVEACANT
jgi:hypothetical protein